MDFYQVIENRQSVRNFDSDKEVSKDILDKIVNAGRVAPSACNIQPWQFWVVSSAEMLKKVKECYERDWLNDAPHILIVVGDKDKAWVRSDGYNSVETDATIAMDHIILAAESFGVSTCWIAAFNNLKLREVLKLSENQKVFAITPLGYSKDNFEKKDKTPRKSLEEVVKYL